MFTGGSLLAWTLSPLQALLRWPLDRRILMLHSGRFHPRWARRTILAQPVQTLRFSPLDPDAQADPLERLHDATADSSDLWIGHIGYDIGRWIEKLPSHAKTDRTWPTYEFGRCPGYLVFDLETNLWTAHGTWADPASADRPDLQNLPENPGRFAAANLRGDFTQKQYHDAVQRVIDYISAGDIFQANLAQRFTADFNGPYPSAARGLFQRLAGVSPAWYGAYLELESDPASPKRSIVSTSPELFLEVGPDRRIITRPIKGTRPASVPADELRQSEKDIAELNMIVDLLRNDLGRVCEFGSIQVTQPRTIESHPTIHHGVATIVGQLRKDAGIVDLLRATLPGGSITGAPKIRAMEIIDELEPVRRGPYCGIIGHLTRDAACFNIAIRTLLVETGQNDSPDSGRVDFSVGGGIVADSVPSKEYQETLDKAAAAMMALGLTL